MRRAVEQHYDGKVAFFASGSLSHRFAQNGLAPEYANKMWSPFLEQLDHAVVFIDEFDEIASAREKNPSTKGVVNELLKMIPLYRSAPGHLLVCATNFVGDIDSAVLRPGRFDLVIPIGPPDLVARRALWTASLASLDHQGADIDLLP